MPSTQVEHELYKTTLRRRRAKQGIMHQHMLLTTFPTILSWKQFSFEHISFRTNKTDVDFLFSAELNLYVISRKWRCKCLACTLTHVHFHWLSLFLLTHATEGGRVCRQELLGLPLKGGRGGIMLSFADLDHIWHALIIHRCEGSLK